MTLTLSAADDAGPSSTGGNRVRALRSPDELLALCHRGADGQTALDEARSNLREIGLALCAHQMDFGGQPEATLSLTFKIKRTRQGGITFTSDQTVKLPKPPSAAGAAFSDEDGGIALDDPRRSLFDMRDVSGTDPEIRNPGDET